MKKATPAQKLLLAKTALGEAKADKVFLGGTLINVHTLETYPADIAVKEGRIAYIGDVSHTIGPNTQQIDVSGKYLSPGMIDCHLHTGGSHLSMTEWGKLALIHGGCCVATDMYEIGVVCGIPGIRFFVEELKATGLRPLFVIPMPAFHQNELFENLGTFTESDAMEALHWEDCYGINELNLSKIVSGDAAVMRIVDECHRLGKTIVGHASEMRDKRLQAAMNYVGLTGDHECVHWEDAVEKARLGMSIQVRDGSVGSDIDALIGTQPQQLNLLGDWAFSSDENDPTRMYQKGYMDEKVRHAIQMGAPALAVYRAATLNAARFFRLDDQVGSIAPGKYADILVIDDLEKASIHSVYMNGELLAQEGRYLRELSQPDYPAFLKNTVHLEPLSAGDFSIPAPQKEKVTVRVIGLNDGSLFSTPMEEEFQVKNGQLYSDTVRDFLKIFTFDRHQRTGKTGCGFIHGLGLKAGAIASCYNPCSENLNVVGTNEQDMAIAANYLIEKGGGFVAVKDGQILHALDLPLAGLFSQRPYEQVSADLISVYKAIETLGCPIKSPFHQLAFMVYPGHFGTYKLCTWGLVDMEKNAVVDLIVK